VSRPVPHLRKIDLPQKWYRPTDLNLKPAAIYQDLEFVLDSGADVLMALCHHLDKSSLAKYVIISFQFHLTY
jgi:hypothetical protein